MKIKGIAMFLNDEYEFKVGDIVYSKTNNTIIKTVLETVFVRDFYEDKNVQAILVSGDGLTFWQYSKNYLLQSPAKLIDLDIYKNPKYENIFE